MDGSMSYFKNLSIVKKFSYEGNEYYLKEISESQMRQAEEDSKGDGEALTHNIWQLMLCDKSGKLANMSEDEIRDVPLGLMRNILDNMMSLVKGEKKS
jgi:hypothetical protein